MYRTYLVHYYRHRLAWSPWNIDEVIYFSAILSTVNRSHNLRATAPVFALLNSPIDMMGINVCSI